MRLSPEFTGWDQEEPARAVHTWLRSLPLFNTQGHQAQGPPSRKRDVVPPSPPPPDSSTALPLASYTLLSALPGPCPEAPPRPCVCLHPAPEDARPPLGPWTLPSHSLGLLSPLKVPPTSTASARPSSLLPSCSPTPFPPLSTTRTCGHHWSQQHPTVLYHNPRFLGQPQRRTPLRRGLTAHVRPPSQF